MNKKTRANCESTLRDDNWLLSSTGLKSTTVNWLDKWSVAAFPQLWLRGLALIFHSNTHIDFIFKLPRFSRSRNFALSGKWTCFSGHKIVMTTTNFKKIITFKRVSVYMKNLSSLSANFLFLSSLVGWGLHHYFLYNYRCIKYDEWLFIAS